MTTTEKLSPYQQLCEIADVDPYDKQIDLNTFIFPEDIADKSFAERLTAGLQVFLELVAGDEKDVERIDKVLLDHYIAKLDQVIGAQLDEILHNKDFLGLESLWQGLKYLVDRTDFRANTKLELLDVDKETLRSDFQDAADTTQSGLYKHAYIREYDTPGGEPIAAMISNFEFDSNAQDISLLTELSKVAAVAHCPFFGSVGASFFNKESIQDVAAIEDLNNYMERADFIRWNSFRQTEDSRYIGLTLPNFLLRLPYGSDNPVRSFIYEEQFHNDVNNYLWGNATYAFAANIVASFKEHGWLVNIRGPEAGGKVTQLPLHQYDVGRGLQTKIPTQVLIPETRELEFSNLGFIPLSYYKNSDFACFFSANSTQKPAEFNSPGENANSRINARLPYIFLSSRIAHYLKVQQRENIGLNKSRGDLENDLNVVQLLLP